MGDLRHLFRGYSLQAPPNISINVALHYFHGKLLILNSQRPHGALFIKFISSEVGRKMSLTGSDIVEGTTDYYALPKQSKVDMTGFLNMIMVQLIKANEEIETAGRGMQLMMKHLLIILE